MDNEKLTLNWIIETLSKSGINSKKIVKDRLRNAKSNELYALSADVCKIANKKFLEETKKVD